MCSFGHIFQQLRERKTERVFKERVFKTGAERGPLDLQTWGIIGYPLKKIREFKSVASNFSKGMC